MKFGKAAGPSVIVAEMLSASGDRGIEFLTMLTKPVFSIGAIPSGWQESFLLHIYKGKSDMLDRGNYRALKLTDQVMKLLEHVLEKHISQTVNIMKCSLVLFLVGKQLMLSLLSLNCNRHF